MRGLLYLVVGLLLGCNAVLAFAAIQPDDILVRRPGGGIDIIKPYNPGWSSTAGGGASFGGSGSLGLGGTAVTVQTARGIAGSQLAKIGVGLARSAGPIGLAMTLAPLIWDELQWLVQNEVATGNRYIPARQWTSPNGSSGHGTAEAACAAAGRSLGSLQTSFPSGPWTLHSYYCKYASGSQDGYSTTTESLVCKNGGYLGGGGDTGYCVGYPACAVGLVRSPTGACVAPRRSATDQEVEDALYVELVARGMGSELARRLVEAGYEPQVTAGLGPSSASGPSRVPGDTSTKTTSGPSGQTTSTTNNYYDLSYNTNTITVSQTTTTTTTHPDNTTETSTETTTPSSEGQGAAPSAPAEEQKTDCDKYPQASGCQPLGEVEDQEIGKANRTIGGLEYASEAGSCPAPLSFEPISASGSYMIEWDPVCRAADWMRPVIVGLAWLSAGAWVFWMARGSG